MGIRNSPNPITYHSDIFLVVRNYVTCAYSVDIMVWLQPVSAVPVTSGMSAGNVVNVVGNPSQLVATAIQPRPNQPRHLIAQHQSSVTSALPSALSQSAVVSRLVQPSASAVSASPAGWCNSWNLGFFVIDYLALYNALIAVVYSLLWHSKLLLSV